MYFSEVLLTTTMWSVYSSVHLMLRGFVLTSVDTFSFKVFYATLIISFSKYFDFLTFIFRAVCILPDVVYCGTVFHELWGILHNLQHFLITVNDLVYLDFVVPCCRLGVGVLLRADSRCCWDMGHWVNSCIWWWHHLVDVIPLSNAMWCRSCLSMSLWMRNNVNQRGTSKLDLVGIFD